MDSNGALYFGIYDGTTETVSDGVDYASSPYGVPIWHYVVGTYASAAGTMNLFVDGNLVAQKNSFKSKQSSNLPFRRILALRPGQLEWLA